MKQTKRVYMDTVLYDYLSIQRRLEALAAEGWQLEKISSGFGIWHFRRAEPANVRYEVTFAPSGSEYNPRPTEAEEDLTDYCAQAGWEKVASLAQMHIYRNADPGATPIETDDAVRLQTLHAAMRKNTLPSQWVLLVLWCVNLAMHLWSNSFRPLESIANALTVHNLFTQVALVAMFSLLLLSYYSWRKKAWAAVEEGLPIPEPVFYRRLKWAMWATVAFIFLGLFTAARQWFTAVLVAGMFALMALSFLLMSALKKRGTDAGVNRIVTFAVVTVSMLALVVCVTWFAVKNHDTDWQAYAETPLELSELIESDDFTQHSLQSSSSFLASYREDMQSSDDAYIHYRIFDGKVGFLADWGTRKMYQEAARDVFEDDFGTLEEGDAALWSADRVWHYATASGSHTYVLNWGKRTVSLYTNLELTAQQRSILVQALKAASSHIGQ